ncbi:hypothetical protein M8J75_013104 [Diaphorina citri]|nr:hypothetical protein M8J75_013104 [Diaphorina citri]
MEEDRSTFPLEREVKIEYDSDNALRAFITTYESLPCLWNPSHPHYSKKPERKAALTMLQQIYVKIKPGATQDDVRRKINTLRSNYRKDLRRIEETKQSGGEVYIPTSWVFHALKFLDSLESEGDEESGSEQLGKGLLPLDVCIQSTTGQTPSVESEAPNYFSDQYLLSRSPSPEPPRKKFTKVNRVAKLNNLLERTCSQIESSPRGIPTIARAWGEKLEMLEPHQRLLAEKAINDVLFEASMGLLHRNYTHEFMSSTNNPPPCTSSGEFMLNNPTQHSADGRNYLG